MTKRALVLSGGGVKGAYQVGVLTRWMVEQGLDYDILCGISVGALNCGFISQYPIGEGAAAVMALRDQWARVNNERIRKSWAVFGKLASLWKPSVFNSQPLVDWVMSGISAEATRKSGRTVRIGAVAWDTGEYDFGTEQDPDFPKWVAASASFPVFLLPVDIRGRLWSDGGLRNVTPLGEAIRLGATEIDVVMCSNPELPTPWNPNGKKALPGYAIRAVDLMSDEIIRTDLQVCGLKNDLAEIGAGYRKVRVRVMQPSTHLVEDALDFDQKAVQRMMDVGYQDAANA